MICHFILYVNNQADSTDFYRKTLAIEPILNVPGMTEFKLGDHCILGLMPSAGIKRLLGDTIPDPERARGVPRAEIYLRVSDPEKALERAISFGAKELSPFQERNWGANAGYVMDQDGHVLAFST